MERSSAGRGSPDVLVLAFSLGSIGNCPEALKNDFSSAEDGCRSLSFDRPLLSDFAGVVDDLVEVLTGPPMKESHGRRRACW